MALRKRKQPRQNISSEPQTCSEPIQHSSTSNAIRFSLLSCFVLCFLAIFYALYPSTSKHLRPLKAPLLKDSPVFDEVYTGERLWGTYRSGLYLGHRMRLPSSLLTGLMWFDPTNLANLHHIRHSAETENIRFGWTMHDGKDFGIQSIHDRDLGAKIETSWIKKGPDWSLRVSLKEAKSGGLAFLFYVADEAGPDASLNWELTDEKIGSDGQLLMKGNHAAIGDWSLGISAVDLSQLGIFKVGLPVNAYHNLTEVVRDALQHSLQMQFYLREGSQAAVEMRLMDPPLWSVSGGRRPNLAVFQVICKAEYDFDLVFMTGEQTQSQFNALSGPRLSDLHRNQAAAFEAEFEKRILAGRELRANTKTVMMHAFSSLIGGIGYFHGASRVRMPEDASDIRESFTAALLTAVPSRTSFPRGFLWDEGFHLLVIQKWDPKLCADVLAHWLDLLNEDGWMAREQILGEESRSRVPSEFIVQDPTIGNPPTLFLPLMEMARDADFMSLMFLERAWPRLVKWFEWLRKNHEGTRQGTFRWTSRKASPNRLNPLTLDSGLDDYPRASHPTEDEYHLDARCWMVLAADAMMSIGKALKKSESEVAPYAQLRAELSDMDRLKALHYDEKTGWFADYGLHSDAIQTAPSQQSSSDTPTTHTEGLNQTDPMLTWIPHFGYVSLFPFILKLFPPDHSLLGHTLHLIEDPDLLWTEYGLRSLAKSSSFYGRHNTEHDPPYWRGSIWININYLVLEALHYYSGIPGPHAAHAQRLHTALRENVIGNVVRECERTGFLWEQYDDVTGHGKGVRPFAGWTSLIVLM